MITFIITKSALSLTVTTVSVQLSSNTGIYRYMRIFIHLNMHTFVLKGHVGAYI